MSARIKDSERQKMLIDYVKTGYVPDGFYVKQMKDGRIQFRRVKKPADKEILLHKIELYKLKIKQAEEAIRALESNSSDENEN